MFVNVFLGESDYDYGATNLVCYRSCYEFDISLVCRVAQIIFE